MTKVKRSVEVSALACFALSAVGQKAPSVTQTATHSTCANIVALSGAKVDCRHLTEAQTKALSRIPEILKMTIENKAYFDAILEKLNQMSTPTPPVSNYAPGGFATSGGTVINPQVNNYGYISKQFTDEQIEHLALLMRPYGDSSDRGDLITSQMGDTNSLELALQLVKVFRVAGWNLPGTGYNMAMMSNPPEDLIISVQSAKTRVDGKVDSTGLPPGVAEFAAALQQAGIRIAISVDSNIPSGKFRIIVGTKP